MNEIQRAAVATNDIRRLSRETARGRRDQMGYDLHVTRRTDRCDDGLYITLAEWQAYVKSAPDMRLDGFAEVTADSGEKVRVEAPGLAVWKGYSKHVLRENQAWFLHEKGQITVKNPDAEIRRKMFIVAQSFGGHVRGDDGEIYDRFGDADQKTWEAPPKSSPWWRFWR